MQSDVVVTDGICFSNRSYNEINHFIEKDSRSSCLRRRYSSTQRAESNDSWLQKKFVVPNSVRTSNVDVSISFASLSNSRGGDLLLFAYKTDYVGIEKNISLLYGYVKDIWSTSHVRSDEEIQFKSLGLEPSHYQFQLRSYPFNSYNSKGVILSYSGYTNKVKTQYYRVGSMKSNGEINIDSWGKERVVDDVDPLTGYDIDIEMYIGNIKNEQSNDLLYMQLRQSRTVASGNEGGKTLRYKIGFNVSSTGLVQSGWSDYFTIPGDFDKAISISGSIMDVDGDRKPDLVIYVVDDVSSPIPSGYTYFRVGKDLTSDGIIEGGWTDQYMIIPENYRSPVHNKRAMVVGRNSESNQTAIIVAHYNTYGEIALSISDKDIFKKVMKTTKKYSAIETVSGSCEICFNGALIEKCQHQLNVCKSKIDRLRILQDPPERISSSSRMQSEFGQFGHSDISLLRSKSSFDDYFTQATNRYDLNTSSKSLYCTGFQYFLDNEDVCNTIDAKSVYSKGLEIIFTKYLNETIKEEDINSTSLFEDPLGTNSNGEPVILKAEIHGRKRLTKKKIKNALRKALAKKQIPSKYFLEDLNGRKTLFTTKRYWNKTRKLWVITFILSVAGLSVF